MQSSSVSPEPLAEPAIDPIADAATTAASPAAATASVAGTTRTSPTPPPIRYGQMARRAPDGAIDFDTLFDDGAPTGPRELEVGFGRGRFLIERALAAPGSRVLGIEIKAKWGHLVEERRKRDGLRNVVGLAADARLVLPRLGPDGGLARAFLHFPDPWWKKRHGKRRVLDEDFLREMARLLAPGAELFVQTDVEERAIDMRDQIAEYAPHGTPVFSVDGDFTRPNPYGARSNREARADEDHLPVYRVLATRR